MIPVQLELKNFLAYTQPDPLLFEGIHVACLSGPNGAGKSSLLDAITWAIWGKSRARSDDDLVHIGKEETQVMLDFRQNGDKYRIIRKRRLGKGRKDGSRGPGTTVLDFFAFDPATNTYRLISESTIRDTQAHINDLLALDYDTFVNSAFLQQGQADAFTIKTPAQRKEILAEILGLNRWLAYEDRVKQKLRDIDNNLTVNQMRLDDFAKEQAQEEAIRQNLAAAQADLAQLEEAVQAAQDAYNEYAGADKELQAARSELDNLRRMAREQEKNQAEAEADIQRNQQKRADYQALLDQREAIEAGLQQLQEARAANDALADALRELNDVEKHINQLERAIDAQRQELELEASQLETRIEDAQATAANLADLEAQEADLRQQIEALQTLEAERDTHQTTIQNLGEERAALEAENEALKAEMYTIEKRMTLVEEADSAACPVCGQPLDETHRAQILDDFQAEGTQRGDRFRANKERLTAIADEIKEQEAAVKALNAELADLPALGSQLGSLEQQLKDARQAAQNIEKWQAELDKLAGRIKAGDFAPELREQLARAQAEQEALAYDEATHQSIKETLSTYQDYQEQANALAVAQQALPDIEANIQQAEERAERWANLLAESHEKIAACQETIEALEGKVVEMEQRREALSQKNTQKSQALNRVAGYQQQIRTLEEQREQAEKIKVRIAQLREEQTLYEQLRKAFGKNGVPAMLIDAALPELETTANQLLRKMTNGRMTVRFDTQRQKKTGGVTETLDISISDELGTRDYSLYSGGEAFRVNFAIRVAISQLLARRAGAQLRTLFVDEGFGTQDEEGRQRLTEAINAVQDDFDLILVITHIDELRDAFPVRIEIEKQAGGSCIRLL